MCAKSPCIHSGPSNPMEIGFDFSEFFVKLITMVSTLYQKVKNKTMKCFNLEESYFITIVKICNSSQCYISNVYDILVNTHDK